ncbi:MAG: DNA translocase FtsK [Verrucomicrobiaceae bacterium]|nr:MAG: DNA translocase FtsK [Verrucomicrobiaceae bacterium]
MNPFSWDIVKNPTEIPATVSSLNQGVLESLEAAFTPLNAGATPRRPAGPGSKARLVLSPAPGYGKSHLIGRLCRNLAGKASVVAFTPFQSADLCWQSLLLQVLRTLQSPVPPATAGPCPHNRLADLAQDVIRHLVAWSITNRQISHPDPATAAQWALNHLALGPPSENLEWNAELHGLFSHQPGILRKALAHSGVSLADHDWPAVLFRYAVSEPFSEQQERCVAWMKGQMLSSEARGELGLTEASTLLPESSSAGDLNDRCRERFLDLCRLAAFHRPFVFCFDQTEVFAQSNALAGTFGRVIAELCNEAPHQLTVVTMNQALWDGKLRKGMEEADVHRFQLGLKLKGLHRAEGEELIQKLTAGTAAQEQKEALNRIMDPGWLTSLFPTSGTNIPAREFLHHCQHRWDGMERIQHTAVNHQADPAIIISRYQELLTAGLTAAANPKSTELHYMPDLFRWLTGTLLARSGECGPADQADSYAELQWTLHGQAVIRFGFAHASSDSYATWKRLAEYARDRRRHDAVPVSKLVHFRTPELQRCPIPRNSWKVNGPIILTALGECLQVIDLTPEETAAIHAARQLYLEAESGDLEGIKGANVIPFLLEKLDGWRDRLLAPLVPSCNGGHTGTAAGGTTPENGGTEFGTRVQPSGISISIGATHPNAGKNGGENTKHGKAPTVKPGWQPNPNPTPDLSQAIVEAYASFKIPVTVLGRREAPQLIRYHLQPGPGITFGKIKSHAINLQIQLGLHFEPLIGSGPGYVFLDALKEKPDTILWRDAMRRPEIADHSSLLALPIGVNINNSLIIADLCDSNTAHALIGGSSGSGKSELLKAFVATLIQRNTPKTLQLTLVDPKLLTFGGIPANSFLSGPVLRDIGESLKCLEEAVEDMERRYEILNHGKFTRLGERIAAGLTDLPYRVLIFDEFADLINSGKKERQEFERLIKIISAKGRAAGVHLIIATQRPDREVVTGQIKANLPLKICLRVTSATNSQILLDEPGAELLLGRGDLLCQAGSPTERGQALFVPQEEFLGLFPEATG